MYCFLKIKILSTISWDFKGEIKWIERKQINDSIAKILLIKIVFHVFIFLWRGVNKLQNVKLNLTCIYMLDMIWEIIKLIQYKLVYCRSLLMYNYVVNNSFSQRFRWTINKCHILYSKGVRILFLLSRRQINMPLSH